MLTASYEYVIIGGGLAGVSAIEGIRERDKTNSVILFGKEPDLPYDRPPLSKKLWSGKTTLEKIFLHDRQYYRDENVKLETGVAVVSVDPAKKTVTDNFNNTYGYGKLLLATGGRPNPLAIPGGHLPEICYFRNLDDYRRLRKEAGRGKTAVIIGGGFIGSELAAALTIAGAKVVMIFPGRYLCGRVFPDYLGGAIQEDYLRRGIEILSDKPASITRKNGRFITRTETGKIVGSDLLIAGVGINPETGLALAAGLKTGDGIVVDEFLRTSYPDIYAAGDAANFPCKALGRNMRMEHWDNARSQGRHAGGNMAGAEKPFEYLPYFFSDLFDFGYEAIGEIDSRLGTIPDWQEENRKGAVYYLDGNTVRGVLVCNVWDKIAAARRLIGKDRDVPEEIRAELAGRHRSLV